MNVHSIKDERTRAPRGRPRVDDKRRLILDAALRVFAERGYHGTAVPEVAQAAKVSTGTLYHYFESKELLVNEVYRDAKTRLRATLLDTLPKLDPYQMDQGRAWFTALWNRLGAFARAEPDAFRFLEMQDHTPYLDNESKQLELSVLAPLWLEGKRLTDRASGATGPGGTSDAPPVDVAIALLWGAFVGLIKASRLGYLTLDDTSLARAGAACWRMIAPQMPRAATPARPRAATRSSRQSPLEDARIEPQPAALTPTTTSTRSANAPTRIVAAAHTSATALTPTRAATTRSTTTPKRPGTAPTLPSTTEPTRTTTSSRTSTPMLESTTAPPRTPTRSRASRQKVPRSPRTWKG